MIITNYWTDENGNRWDCSLFTREEAEKFSKTLINCKFCTNCISCTDCQSCEGCGSCGGCRDCVDCEYCTDCSGCCGCLHRTGEIGVSD